MVKIAIAGGAGNVGQEIIDVLLATKKHDITILTRKDPPANYPSTSVKWLKTNYSSVTNLAAILHGTHTVLSFISPHLDQDAATRVQMNLIDACVRAGVQRFAPSEWGSAHFAHMPWYTYKSRTRAYLTALNISTKVLEYSLFQPGLFTNYLTAPHASAKHLTMFCTPFDFANKRVLMAGGSGREEITLTTVQDLARVVAKAVEYEGVWPVYGGIVGCRMSVEEMVMMGERVRGGRFDVTTLKMDELENGTWESPWVPRAEHPAIAAELADAVAKTMTAGLLLAVKYGAFKSGETWNRLLPDFEFEDAEMFLRREWEGKA